MRAVVIREFGEPKLLRVEEIKTPEPSAGEALVEVKAAAINPSDVKNAQGAMHGTTLPRIPGRDFAGKVARGPADVMGLEVWGTGGDIGFTRDGTHAQFVAVPVKSLTPKPKNLSMDDAGQAGLTFVTAWSSLVTAANVSEGDTVLIIGAGGGVGSAAAQIAKARKATVIGAVKSDEDAAAARQYGADHMIDTSKEQFAEAVKSITNGRGADVVFDTSGKMFAEGIEAAAMGGRVAVITAPSDGKTTFNLRSIYRKELKVHGVDTRRLDAVACAALLAQMRSGFESGKFKVKPGYAFPLDKASEAYEKASRGEQRYYLRP
jgi:NADPH:quinone reductase